ncbi:MAG: TetR family transcriptional regulator [Nocardia sp.]|nr:TetR family transcriptional regulator [Nocardia sp.]
MLAGALHAFAAYGYAGVSLRTLARELGVSHNLLHQRYGSKAGMWFACVDWGFGGLVERLDDIVTADGSDRDRLHAFLFTFALFSARNPDLHRLVNIESSAPSDRLNYLCDNYARPTADRILPLYTRAVERNELRAVPIESLYYLITSGVGAMYSGNALTDRLFGSARLQPDRLEEHAHAVADLLIDGLRPTPHT